MYLPDYINTSFSALTVLAQVLVAVFLLSLLLKKQKWAKSLHALLRGKGVLFAFIVALTAMCGSLIYSEILKYEPCKLCWFERIFMYPQVFILGLALILEKFKKISSHLIKPYGIFLSVFGLAISLYHYMMQVGFVPELPCSAVGYSASCAKLFVLQFGYITIPLMALSAFALIISFLSLGALQKK